MAARGSEPERRASAGGECWAAGQFHDRAVEVFVAAPVLKNILDFSEQDTQRERGGFLVGHRTEAPAERVEVWGFIPAMRARSGAASLRLTHDAWSRLNRELDRRGPDWTLVGWQHTHPQLGVFLSAYDLFIHRHFFRERWHVALVVDPVARQFGFFQWCSNEIVSCGFRCGWPDLAATDGRGSSDRDWP